VSEKNVELVRTAFQALERRDMALVEEVCHPDVVFDWSRRLLDPVVIHGYDGLERFFQEIDGIFEDVRFDVEEVVEFGDQVLMVSTGHFRGRSSGVDVTAHGAQIWSVREGKLASFRFYQSKEDALADLKDPTARSTSGQ
jgi:ketosteroid isomerase-like protein